MKVNPDAKELGSNVISLKKYKETKPEMISSTIAAIIAIKIDHPENISPEDFFINQLESMQVIEYYNSNPDALRELAGPMFEERVMDYILEIAKVTDKETTVEALYAEAEERAKPAKAAKEKKAAKKKAAEKKTAEKKSDTKAASAKKAPAKKAAAKKPAKKAASKAKKS